MFNDPGNRLPSNNEKSLVRPESPHSRSFLSQKLKADAKLVSSGEELGVVEALYREIKESDHEALKALSKRLKGYLDGDFQEPITVELDPEFDSVKVTY